MAKRILTIILDASKTITNGSTAYSNSVLFENAEGYCVWLFSLESASGNLTVTQQCSIDNTNWFDPVDKAGTALGAIATAVTASAYIQFSPVPAPFIRLKYVAGAATTFTSKLLSVE